jgi:1-acyl-sn-glycerol-3-phosphate acyltransferase
MRIPLTHIPFLRSFVKFLEKETAQKGLHDACLSVVKRSRSKFVIEGQNKKSAAILKNKPVVVVANHPHGPELVSLLASLPQRESTYVVVNADLMNISHFFDKHLIPVYIQHHYQKETRLNKKAWLFQQLNLSPRFTEEEEHVLNIKSIKHASHKLKNNSLIIIFPEGQHKWFSGVGHLLRGANMVKDVYIVNVHVSDTSNWDYLRIFPMIGDFLPQITINYSEPYRVNSLFHHHPKIIAAKLEQNYKRWLLQTKTNKT